MATIDRHVPKAPDLQNTTPFQSAEEAWFWFLAAQQAKEEGARVLAGQGTLSRPCEPADIFSVLNRLYRQRRLLMDHIRVLRYYGKRFMAPDPRRTRELKAFTLWREALGRMEEVLERKGIVEKPAWFNPEARPAANWVQDVMIYEKLEA